VLKVVSLVACWRWFSYTLFANNTSLLVVVVDPEGKYEALEKYGIDLTKMAKQGKLDPIIGHDEEI
jgi:ATP-dependent Clp protease ATP-binding subunit ClpA